MLDRDLLTVREASNYLTLSRSMVYLMVQRKEIPHIRLSERRIVIRLADLTTWLEKKKVVENV